jgi:holliday junction DNA helicase RuvB
MPSRDIHDVGPTSLSHIVGQKAVVTQLQIAIDASFEDNTRLPHCLLVGPPGLGKTQMVSATSHELAVESHVILGQSIKSKEDIHALVLPVKDKEILFIDETHGVPRPLQTLLYQAIDRRKISIICGSSLHSIPLENFTLMLATTDEHRLLQPLRDRMKLVLHFQFYSIEELATIVQRYAKTLDWPTEESIPDLIAKRSRGVPRLALNLLENCHLLCRSLGERLITLLHLERHCTLKGLDDLGLNITERRYLQILSQGPNRLNVIASRLGEVPNNIGTVVEPPLLRLGLIEKDDRGRRQLTAMGREHLLKTCSDGVHFV